MAVRTGDQYRESLKQLKPHVYCAGERVTHVTDHPLFRTGINQTAEGYDFAHDPAQEHRMTLVSPLIGEAISRLTHMQRDTKDAVTKLEVVRSFVQKHVCMNCGQVNGPCGLWATTYETDQKHQTQYHGRFVDFIKYVQKNDLRTSGVFMDPKGDRSRSPTEQADPDLYLHIVERRKNGIVVRGARVSITGAPYRHELIVIPSRALREAERDYAVSFAIPVDTPGVKFIARPTPSPQDQGEMDNPVSSRYGDVECITVFEDVFVPWERVFMCGEWEFAGRQVHFYGSLHRQCKCACMAARFDLLTGAGALIAEYNGLERVGHIREKLTELMTVAEIAYGCGLGAAVDGYQHPSGVWIPNGLTANAGLYYARSRYGEAMGLLQDVAGGLVVTMPTEKDYLNPETRPYMEKYLKGKADIPTEHRIRAFKLIEDLTASRLAGWLLGSSVCSGGTLQTHRVEVVRRYDLEARKKAAQALAGIRTDKS